MKKKKFSSFKIGQEVVVTNNCGRFIENQVVTILDNEKKGKRFTNKVKDDRGIIGVVPTKYLNKI